MIVPEFIKNSNKFSNTCKIVKITTHHRNDDIDGIHKKSTVREYFTWSKRGREALEAYHRSKIPVNYSQYKKPQEKKKSLSKEEKLALRQYSEYHYKLINQAYSKESAENRLLKQAASDNAHEIVIENLMARLKIYKYSLKFRNSKNCKYKIVVWVENEKHKPIIFTEKYVPNVTQAVHEAAETYNSNMSKYMFYHHTSIYDIENKRPVALFTRNLIEFKEAVTMCAA